mgnify:CR=1 FL=1
MTVVLMRRGENTHKETNREGLVMMLAEVKVMQLPAKEHWDPLEAGRSQEERFLPRTSEETWPCRNLDLRNVRIPFCCFKPLSLGSLLQQF